MQSAGDETPDPPAHPQGHIVLAAAPSIDSLADLVAQEVGASLPEVVGELRIGTTSTAPRDAAARVSRWVSRLGARREIPTTLSAPAGRQSSRSLLDLVEIARPRPPRRDVACVGVSRLHLSPAVTAVDQPYAIGVWLPLVHRTGLRSRVADPAVELVQAALRARPVFTCLIGRAAGMSIIIVGQDLLACEVVGRAIRAAAQPVGDLGLSPWEAPVVQRGIELAAEVTHPDAIQVESRWLGEPADPTHDRFHAIVGTAMARAGIRG